MPESFNVSTVVLIIVGAVLGALLLKTLFGGCST
jgi:hypothetical protein